MFVGCGMFIIDDEMVELLRPHCHHSVLYLLTRQSLLQLWMKCGAFSWAQVFSKSLLKEPTYDEMMTC